MTCIKCLIPYLVFKIIPSDFGYWVATEVFVKLHNGKDSCIR